MMRALFLALALLFAGSPALAVNPDEILSDPALEARARALSANLRCMVCQNQSIDDSNAELARDLRVLVRERIVRGDSDEQVIDYVVSRYGEFVLLKPRLSMQTLILWGAPAALFALGAIALFLLARRHPPATATAPLTDAEKAQIERLLVDDPAKEP
ncbi:cytochrome c-type biogenesis protein CcmH [Rhizobiaceae bacterium BDR2-2]|uniref:Cytochrome c-type biogenesis protein n=1 Tax=Ectorhizobium quercum TaxID=2965071 RepID=A0AAE3N1X9_9HYPH|nr:cytochrome c-type biogenesis protein [Ectorhizobium quercum]MCX8998446.1 cytochrome c-type biogenesis protein CcmH [Ectorhizobium quercum]